MKNKPNKPRASSATTEITDYEEAVDEVLYRASKIRLPGHRLNVVTIARRAFWKVGGCDHKFIQPIEDTLDLCLKEWSSASKSAIWASMLDQEPGSPVEEAQDWIDLYLHEDLLFYIIEALCPPKGRRNDRSFYDENDDF